MIVMILLLVYSVAGAEGQEQLLRDPGFEESTPNGTFPDGGYWKSASAGSGAYAGCTTTSAHSGSNGLWEYTGSGTSAWWSRVYQKFPASTGDVYTGSAWIRTPSGQSWVSGSLACVRIEFLNSSLNVLDYFSSPGVTAANTTWAEYSVATDPIPSGTQYVRFICNVEKPSGSSGQSIANFDDCFFECVCIIPGTPSNRSPSDGATDVSTGTTLSWSAASSATSYDVYFGTSVSPPYKANTTSTEYNLGGLNQDTTYYWKIVAKNSCGSAEGPVWTFTTIQLPTIAFSPSSFSFTATQGGSDPASQTLGVNNSGGGTLNWSVGDDVTWVSLNPTSGTSTGETDNVTVSVNTSGMGAGSYSATITISAPGATNTPQTLPVSLSIDTIPDHEANAYQHLYDIMDKHHESFDVYSDQDAGGNHFFPSGWMGDISAISFDSNWTSNPHSGTSCIKVSFTAKGDNWTGIYWQDPENNWGDNSNGGYDLSGAVKLTFWARGEEGGETVEFFVGGITGTYGDSIEKTSTGYITLTTSWKEYTIDLIGKDLSHVIGGFGWVTNSEHNPDGAAFYLDNIKYDRSRADELRFLTSYETLPFIDPDRYVKNACFIYDNALAMIALLARKEDDDLRRARLLADTFVCAQDNDRYYSDGRLRNAYMSDLIDPQTGKVRLPGWWDPEENKWSEDEYQVSTYTGNMAWVIVALAQYYEAQEGEKYKDAAVSMGEWIIEHTYDTRGAGGYTGGYKGWEPDPGEITWKSTEHNIDVYVAFKWLYRITEDSIWLERAFHAISFVEAMWAPALRHFWTGTLNDGVTINKENVPLDIQAWAVMTLGNYNDALSWAEENCYTEADGFKGFDFNTDKDGVWFEGTGQMAVAYQTKGETEKRDIYVEELGKAQVSATNNNGKGIVAASHDGVTTGFEWEYFSRVHIGATAWYIFAERNYNPLESTVILLGDINRNGSVGLLEDATLALQVISGTNPSGIRSDYASSGADVNGDGKIGLAEVIYILQEVSGLR